MIGCIAENLRGGEQPGSYRLRKALDELVDRLVCVPAQPEVVAGAPLAARNQKCECFTFVNLWRLQKHALAPVGTLAGRTDK